MIGAVWVPPELAEPGSGGWAVTEEILTKLRQIPGVESASVTQLMPLTAWAPSTRVEISSAEEPRLVRYGAVGPDYFETLQIPLLQGRPIDLNDHQDGPPVVVVNQTAARLLWPENNPVGQRLRDLRGGAENATSYQVVGVVADSCYQRPVDPIEPLLYFSYQQQSSRRMTVVARASTPIAEPFNELLYRQSRLAVITVVPFDEQVRRSITDQRMSSDLAGGLGSLGLLLASLGIFSVMSYTVSRRIRELGIRRAVGATAGDITRLVLGETVRLLAYGLALGLAAAAALCRLLAGLLYGIDAFDPLTFAVVPLVLAVVTFAAAWLPARRAAMVDPMSALREEG